jgi:hypothetical protein
MNDTERLLLDIANRLPVEQANLVAAQVRIMQTALNWLQNLLMIVVALLALILWRLW